MTRDPADGRGRKRTDERGWMDAQSKIGRAFRHEQPPRSSILLERMEIF